jgi:hypothetical protein
VVGLALKNLSDPAVPGTVVVGTYLYPGRILEAPPDFNESDYAVEIIHEVSVAGVGATSGTILVNRIGGLFLEVPRELVGRQLDEPNDGDFGKRLQFRESAAADFNLLLCEFALRDLISEPASPVEIASGKRVDAHVGLLGGGGGREAYTKRTSDVSVAIIQGTWVMWMMHGSAPSGVLAASTALARARVLRGISESLPAFVVGAYSNYSKHQLGEAMADAWVAIEQIVNALWDQHKEGIDRGARKRRLSDTRTYTAAVRIEVLEQAGILSGDTAEMFQAARGKRNELMHGGAVSWERTEAVMDAMKHALEHVLGQEVTVPSVARYVDF